MTSRQSIDDILTYVEKLLSVRKVSHNNYAFATYEGMDVDIDNLMIDALKKFGSANSKIPDLQREVSALDLVAWLERAVRIQDVLGKR